MSEALVTTISAGCDRDEDERRDGSRNYTHGDVISFSVLTRRRLAGHHPCVSRGSKWMVSTFHCSK